MNQESVKIKSIQITRTIKYSPDAYLEYCEEDKRVPTQQGFLEFISDYIDEDFRNRSGAESIEYVD